MRHVELTSRAKKDLRKMGRGIHRTRILKDLAENLASDSPPANLDVKALRGAEPWHRLRIGEWRVLYREATEREVTSLNGLRGIKADKAVFVARIVNRRDLDEAVKSLE